MGVIYLFIYFYLPPRIYYNDNYCIHNDINLGKLELEVINSFYLMYHNDNCFSHP